MDDSLNQLSPVKRAIIELREMRARLDDHERRASEPVAIVGMGCRFPGGADSPAAFWTLMRDGVDAVSEVPRDRWNIDDYYDPDPDRPGKISTRWGGFLDDVSGFDADFFGISSREAVTLDPQQRLLLEVSWQALENAGIAPETLFGTPAGVFVGIGSFDYMQMQLGSVAPERIDAYFATGGCHSVAAGRLSYVLGLQGPAIAIDTACSSSLVSVHLACQSLRAGECQVALAGGVNVILSPEVLINFSRAHMMAGDGRCKAFDAAADGFVRAEGCGMIVLMRLSDAIASRANVLAVIRGSAINQDGRSSGLTAPNGPSQQSVIRAALARAGVRPSEVQYVEAHGTGTALGDPIEVQALAAVYGEGRADSEPLLIGSVKTNIGHAESAAGIAGLIKTVEALRHRMIPGHLHLTTRNPHIEWAQMPIAIPTSATPWPGVGVTRRAAVSSFGFSGTNAHVVIEEAPQAAADPTAPARRIYVVTASAKRPDAMRVLAGRYADALDDNLSLEDVAYTVNIRRAHFAARGAVVAASLDEARAGLRALAEGREAPGVAAHASDGQAPDIAFLFAGQGSQYPQMARPLYESEPVFRAALDRCDEILRPELGRSILSVIFPEGNDAPSLDQTAWTQPALFAVEYALTELWASWGIVPSAVLGHSLGEDIAACVAGVFSLEDGLKLIAQRGRLMQDLPQTGQMIAVFADEATVARVIAPMASALAIAAVNGPAQMTVSGDGDAIAAAVREFERLGIKVRPVVASHAFHSPLIDPMLDAYERLASQVHLSAPRVGFVSNVTGTFAAAQEIVDAGYWRRHTRLPVRFADGIRALYNRGHRVFLEIGPNATLSGMARHVVEGTDAVWLTSLKKGREPEHLAETLAALYARGAAIDWTAVHAGAVRPPAPLPTYPFHHKRYWFSADARPVAAGRPGWSDVVDAGNRQADMVPIDLGLHTYETRWKTLDELSSAYIVRAFGALGVFANRTDTLSPADIVQRFGIAATYTHLLRRWCRKLAAEGTLREDDDRFAAPKGLPAAGIEGLERAAKTALADTPFIFEYVQRCGRLMADVLTGRESALETLFPGGDSSTAEQIYHHWAVSRYFGATAATALATVVDTLPPDQQVRVIEVGAGTGGLTRSLLPVLPAGRTLYWYTDISEFFFREAQQRFGDHKFIKYGMLDLERTPQSQGYGSHAFDVVVAANVLHATRDLNQTLAHVRTLLAPGGVLLLYEVTAPPSWFDISIALIEGWQRFDDGLREDGPLLPRGTWHDVLSSAGFEGVASFPRVGSPAEILGGTVIIARTPSGAAAGEIGTLPTAIGVTHEAADAALPSTVEDPAEVLRAELAGLPEAERVDRLVEYVRSRLMLVLLRENDEPVGRRHKLMDLGVDSLMAVELRDRLASGLKLPQRLSSTLVFDYPTVEAIAGHLDSLLHGDSAPAEAAAEEVSSAERDAVADMTDEQVAELLATRLDKL